VLASLTEQGLPSALCPRAQLGSAAAALVASTGLTAQAAGEPEFYLFREKAESRGEPYSQDGVSYSIDRTTDPDGVVGEMHRQLAAFGIGVTAVNREYSPGQFEINLDHDDIVRAADSVFLMKCGIKELAVAHGLLATFMAKPRAEFEGSGLHVHVSLWERDGVNAFARPDGTLSPTGLHAIAGLQQHAGALMALAAPTVNSYKRLSGPGLSPRSSSWAYDNRLTFVRIPAERGPATRLELRIGDASASPHLLMAGMLHAVRDGIERRLEPTADGAPLPSDLASALAALQRDEVFAESFGQEFVDVYAALKNREISAFQAHVSDWEWETYRSQV
jgi:glutamine synthetase